MKTQTQGWEYDNTIAIDENNHHIGHNNAITYIINNRTSIRQYRTIHNNAKLMKIHFDTDTYIYIYINI